MKNIKTITFFAVLAIYVCGVFAGSVRQACAENQDEMYSYLESTVAGYNVSLGESIKSVAKDNAEVLVVLLICACFRAGIVGICASAAVKGYSAGFAITAAIRFFGFGGLLFSGASLISAAVLAPSAALFGAFTVYNLTHNRNDGKLFARHYLICAAALFAVLCADGICRGVLSSLLMRFASGFLKKI